MSWPVIIQDLLKARFKNPALKVLYSFATEHIMAKVFAVLFASIVVYLVSRELMDTWIEEESLEVVIFSEAQQTPASRHRIVLKPETDVAIDISGLGPLKMTIKGPEKHTVEFNRRLDIRVTVKRDWAVNAEGWTGHTLTADDLDIGMPGAEIELLDPPEARIIRVNLFETITDVAVVLQVPNGSKLPVGRVWSSEKTKLSPPAVELVRPRSPGAESTQVVVALEEREVYKDGAIVGASLLAAQRENLMRINPPRISVQVALEGEDRKFNTLLEDVPILALMTHKHLEELDSDALQFVSKIAKMTCKIKLAVPYSMPIEERTDEALRAGLTAYINVSIGIEKATKEKGPRSDVKVVGLPAGVEILQLSPVSVAFDVSKGK